MRIRIDRAWCKSSYTISRVFINGVRFGDGRKWCSMLEDKDRGLTQSMTVEEIKKRKVYGQTAIPRGTYEVRITYSPKFRRMLPLLIDVKGFSGIRIHPGNSANDSEGCPLPGVNDIVGHVTSSTYWFNLLFARIQEAEKSGEKIMIEIG